MLDFKMRATSILFLFLCCIFVDLSSAWRGNFETVKRSYTERRTYCACWYWWWGCSYWREYWVTIYYYAYQCQPGWTHNGDQNCNIPVCRPTCQNGGTCVQPNTCNCPSWSSGTYTGCSTLTCSYMRPCYPGNCLNGSTCQCEPGFLLTNSLEGCTTLSPLRPDLQPVVGKSNVTLSNIRRTDGRVDYMFILEGTNTSSNELEIIWSNQRRFNNLRFDYETYFKQPENLPKRPNYVNDAELGIVNSFIEVNVSKVPRDGGRIRDPGSFKIYQCEGGFSRDNPEKEIASCLVNDDQFRTLIEHGDWLNAKFKSDSGGYQKLINLDNQGNPYGTRYYKGLRDVKELQFNFDFIAPKHCTEAGAWAVCRPGDVMMKVDNEFTKDAIRVTWGGWTDDMSGVLEYYIEIFKLGPDPYGKLVELKPINPVFTSTPRHAASIAYPEYRPKEPGMYSVLMETRDTANNSRTARRLVLYDDRSEISINTDSESSLYISNAVAETGYMWMTPTNGKEVTFIVLWANHFVNKIHEDNKLLNAVLEYPIQFKEIQDDGILFSQKYVAEPLDDSEGERTKNAINNFHGVIKFEMAKEFTLNDAEPNTWEVVSPFQETTTFKTQLDDGQRVRLWIRATDKMGNAKTDSTVVRVDGTAPTVSNTGDRGHEIVLNVNGTFNYTSRLLFAASDSQSGVHKLEYTVIIKTPDKSDRIGYTGVSPAMTSENLKDPYCMIVEGKCFIPAQVLDLDNCWFMTKKSELDISTAIVNVTVFNQALLTAQRTFTIGPVKHLKGLEKYDGPENIRIESPSSNGFRIVWDLPEKTSCYGRAEIVLVLLRKDANGNVKLHTFYTSGTSKFFDILGLDPSTDYMVEFGMRSSNTTTAEQGVSLAVKTANVEEKGVGSGAVIGAVVGVLVVVALVAVVLVVLVRKGVIQPAQRVQTVRRAVSRRVRRTVYGRYEPYGHTSKKSEYGYDNQAGDLYIYGGMEDSGPQIWHIDRSAVTLDTLIPGGHFANIYKARLRGRSSGDIVVAKTLKANFTSDDVFAMKAKINFLGYKVGDHPNVLKFIGAVVNDDPMGPFIIYEYCENGPLKDYLVANKHNLTVELTENLFRFGLDIAKGMEYLASKGITHRRLAARNVLLTFLKEAKITGFGPQPAEEDGGDAEQGKKERIPIKWMAPECLSSTKDATEKSDVWSYAIVLWEIFSLGETPYNCKARELPTKLKKGERLLKPEQCDDTWYTLMQKCWKYEPKQRPTFASVRNELDNLFVAAPGDDYYYYKR